MNSFIETLKAIVNQTLKSEDYAEASQELMYNLIESAELKEIARLYTRMRNISDFCEILVKQLGAELETEAQRQSILNMNIDRYKLSFCTRNTYTYPNDEYLQKLEKLKDELNKKIKNHQKYVQGLSTHNNSISYLEEQDGTRYSISAPVKSLKTFIKMTVSK